MAGSAEPTDGPLWLRTAAGYFVDENGAAVALRGVTVRGLDTAGLDGNGTLAGALALDDANVSTVADGWGCNLVRLPFTPGTVLTGGTALAAADLLAALDALIEMLATAGCYALLSVQATTNSGTDTIAPEAYDCLAALGRRYQDEPAVLFEISTAATPSASGWTDSALRMIGTLRREHPGSLVFVGNAQAADDLTMLPLRFSTGDPAPNIAYTLRLAPELQWTASAETQITALARLCPVFASEWSVNAVEGLERDLDFAGLLFARLGIGFAASNWNADPRVIVNAEAHQFTPTRWGTAVQRALSYPVKEPVEPQLP